MSKSGEPFQICEDNSRHLLSATSTPMKTFATIDTETKVNGLGISTTLAVIQSLACNLSLGMGFLKQTGAVIDLMSNT